MKIKETKHWSPYSVRRMCIKYDLYTCGNNKEYAKVLDYVDHNSPSNDNIYYVAKDIVNHSSVENTVESIMFLLNREAIDTFYTCEGVE